jgi:hypothetical protein
MYLEITNKPDNSANGLADAAFVAQNAHNISNNKRVTT